MKLKELLCFALLCLAFTISGCSTVGSQESKNSEKLLTEETQPDQRDYSDLESESPSDSTKDNLPGTDTAGSSQTAPEPGKAQEDSSAAPSASGFPSDSPQTDHNADASNRTQQQDSPESLSQESTADSGFYQDCSSYPSSQIEDFAKNVKSLFLEKDWDAIAALISYPITIDGTICEDHSDFLSLDFESQLNPDFLSAMEAETCQEMFHNWQGISMGAKGELWFSQVYSDESNSSLLITGINGILQQASDDANVY